MAELSESELLLLDNFMYISDSAQAGESVGDIVDTLLANGISEHSLSGGLTVENAQEILQEIQKNPELCDLTIAASIDNEGVRASCFVDENDSATVAFRGTGGSYEAWEDNLLGAYEVDTQYQQMAADFIKDSCADYDNITVTGHSKGGNMAQYCTVLCGDQVDRCVSYDGQGFNDDFLTKYAEEIADNQGKISSVCCEGDYVNILLTSIAGETKYLKTEKGANAHASWELYRNNKNDVDAEGNFTHLVDQSEEMKILDMAADGLVDYLGRLPNRQEQAIVNALASDVGVIFALVSKQLSWEDLWDWYKTQVASQLTALYYRLPIGKIESYLTALYHSVMDGGKTVKKLKGSKRVRTAARAELTVSCRKLQRNVQEVAAVEGELKKIAFRLDDIDLPGNLGSRAELAQSLKAIRQEVGKQQRAVGEYKKTLSACIGYYQETENRCVSQMAAVG